MKLSLLWRLQINFSNRLSIWADLHCEYTGNQILGIFVLYESKNEMISRTTSRKKQKCFGERRDSTGICQHSVFPGGGLNLREFGQKFGQILWPPYQGSFSPEHPSLWQPMAFPTAASHAGSQFGEPGGNSASLLHRGFRKCLLFTQKPFHQLKSEAAGCLQKHLENQH